MHFLLTGGDICGKKGVTKADSDGVPIVRLKRLIGLNMIIGLLEKCLVGD